MARYQIGVPNNKIINISGEPINAYDATGEIATFPPTTMAIDSSHYFIVSEKESCTYENTLVATNKGIGRDGIEVAMLYSAYDRRVRVFPMGVYT